jgi:hypothetical protein
VAEKPHELDYGTDDKPNREYERRVLRRVGVFFAVIIAAAVVAVLVLFLIYSYTGNGIIPQ